MFPVEFESLSTLFSMVYIENERPVVMTSLADLEQFADSGEFVEKA